MNRDRHVRAKACRVLVTLAWMAAGLCDIDCGGATATTPTPTAGGSGTTACRTYATSFALQPDASGVNQTWSDKFNTSTFELTRAGFQDGVACSTTTVKYHSVGDFVDEVRTNPPLQRYVEADVSFTGRTSVCAGSFSTTTFAYDEQGRQTQEFSNSMLRLSYDQWDGNGRPNHGNYPAPGGVLTREYDDVKHTRLDRSVYTNGLIQIDVRGYDANGQEISFARDLNTMPVPIHSEFAYRVTATEKICK